jgi:palmitoyl-protein thioesterase
MWQSMGRIVDLIEENLSGAYVRSLEIGADWIQDMWNSFFMNVNDQVAHVCKVLKADPALRGGFNAVGFSQGGQFLRAYVERCNDPPVRNLITLGGQHQGVYGLPNCPGPNVTLCEAARELLDYGAYIPWIQSFQVQAEYWHDPLQVRCCTFSSG